MLEIRVNRSHCQGAGECVSIARKSFRMDRTICAKAINPPPDTEETLRAAVDACPNMAIELLRDGEVIKSR